MGATMTCEELFHLLEDDELVVVDCRREEQWVATPFHIPGALRMTMADLFRAAHILPDDELIVLVGADPDAQDAQRARQLLELRGRQAVCLQGGLPAWCEAGLPMESHAPGVAPRLQASSAH